MNGNRVTLTRLARETTDYHEEWQHYGRRYYEKPNGETLIVQTNSPGCGNMEYALGKDDEEARKNLEKEPLELHIQCHLSPELAFDTIMEEWE